MEQPLKEVTHAPSSARFNDIDMSRLLRHNMRTMFHLQSTDCSGNAIYRMNFRRFKLLLGMFN